MIAVENQRKSIVLPKDASEKNSVHESNNRPDTNMIYALKEIISMHIRAHIYIHNV